MKYCPYCGKQIDDSVAFCPYCGGQQPELLQQPQQQYQPQPQPQYQSPQQPQPQPQPQYQYQQPPQAPADNSAAILKITNTILFFGTEDGLHKAQHQFGYLPNGTLEMYPDHIDVYIKGKSGAWAYFGVVGVVKNFAAEKGKQTATITYDIITAYKKIKKCGYTIYLNDGNLLYLHGIPMKYVATLEAFLAGKPVII